MSMACAVCLGKADSDKIKARASPEAWISSKCDLVGRFFLKIERRDVCVSVALHFLCPDRSPFKQENKGFRSQQKDLSSLCLLPTAPQV